MEELNLEQRALRIALVREEELLKMSDISEKQLKHYVDNVLYVQGIRHQFLRHEEILRIQQDPGSKIPKECLFNALSYKLGGPEEVMKFSGPRDYYSAAYLVEIGKETRQKI